MIETDFSKRKASFMRQPMPRRLGNLAVNVKRIGAHSDGAASKEGSLFWVIETRHFAEWTAIEAPQEIQSDLTELMAQLSNWQLNWDTIWSDPISKTQMQVEAKAWGEKLFEKMDALMESAQ